MLQLEAFVLWSVRYIAVCLSSMVAMWIVADFGLQYRVPMILRFALCFAIGAAWIIQTPSGVWPLLDFCMTAQTVLLATSGVIMCKRGKSTSLSRFLYGECVREYREI